MDPAAGACQHAAAIRAWFVVLREWCICSPGMVMQGLQRLFVSAASSERSYVISLVPVHGS